MHGVTMKIKLKTFIYTFPNPCLYQALLFQLMTSSSLLLVTFINFSYILMLVCPSNMQRSFHNNNESINKTKQNNKHRTLLCTTVSTGFTYVFSVHFIAAGVYYFVSCCVIAVLCCVMPCVFLVILIWDSVRFITRYNT